MATTDQKADTTTRELNAQALALAEQLGRIAGTLEGTAEAWLNRASVTDQLTKVRDGATQLLNSLAGGAMNGRKAAQAQSGSEPSPTAAGRTSGTGSKSPAGKAKSGRGRSASATTDLAHAPGKRHRKPAPTVRGAKKSDERIPKARIAETVRHRRKSYA
jgi:hypothetical protein